MLLLVEDKRFAIHFGIDPVAIARALIFDMRGGVLQGASTIGQQVYSIRQSGNGRRSRTLSYKFRQVMWAMFASAFTSRIDLLTEYLNGVYWGRSYLGLDSAAEGYFKKRRGELSVVESFFLAERIATPNRISVPRISNLLGRSSIVKTLHAAGASSRDVIATYEEVYGCGGQTWELLEKCFRR
jgi:penicillin-binding protein 1A